VTDSGDSSDKGGAFRVGGVSYLDIPATDPRRSAEFYRAVFGWNVRNDDDPPAFEDGTGHVIGHFLADGSVVGDAGVIPYVYVTSIDEALAKVQTEGGDVARDPYPEGDLWVAALHDPAGNVIGVWQSGPRSGSDG
jgi:predicted enzyme related to lactoylglutathione lyase